MIAHLRIPRLSRSVVFSGASMAANLLLPLAAIPLLVRALGSDIFGTLVVAQAITVLGIQIVDFGYALGGSRAAAVAELEGVTPSVVYTRVQCGRLALAAVALILLVLVTALFDLAVPAKVVLAAGIPALIGNVFYPVWFFQGRGMFGWLALANLFSKGTYFLFSALAVTAPEHVFLSALSFGCTYLLGGLVLQVGLWREGVRWSFAQRQGALAVWWSNLSAFISTTLMSWHLQLIVIVVAHLSGPATAGVLATADRLIRGAAGVGSPFWSAAFPKMSRLSATSPEEAAVLRRRLLRWLIAGSVVLVVILNVAAPLVASFMFPTEPAKFSQLMRILSPVLILVPVGVAYGGNGLVVIGALHAYLWAVAGAELVGFVALFIGYSFVPETYGAWAILATELAIAFFMTLAFTHNQAAKITKSGVANFPRE